MSTEAFEERGHSLEEDYFRRMERQQLEALRLREQLARERELLAEATGIRNDALLEELRALGYTPQTTPLLELVPLVEMAWAEGSVQGRERKMIFDTARGRGIGSESEAFKQLGEWLEHRPSNDFFARSLELCNAVLRRLPAGERDVRRQSLLADVYKIADAAGGLGFINIGPRVCREEEETFDRIIHNLQPEAAPETPGAA